MIQYSKETTIAASPVAPQGDPRLGPTSAQRENKIATSKVGGNIPNQTLLDEARKNFSCGRPGSAGTSSKLLAGLAGTFTTHFHPKLIKIG